MQILNVISLSHTATLIPPPFLMRQVTENPPIFPLSMYMQILGSARATGFLRHQHAVLDPERQCSQAYIRLKPVSQWQKDGLRTLNNRTFMYLDHVSGRGNVSQMSVLLPLGCQLRADTLERLGARRQVQVFVMCRPALCRSQPVLRPHLMACKHPLYYGPQYLRFFPSSLPFLFIVPPFLAFGRLCLHPLLLVVLRIRFSLVVDFGLSE